MGGVSYIYIYIYIAYYVCALISYFQVVNKVADCNSARVNLTADMADDSQRIKVIESNYSV